MNSYRLKASTRNILAYAGRYIFFLAFAYVILYPFIFIAINSVKGFSDFYDPSVQWVPKHFSLANFKVAIQALDFWHTLVNTFIYSVLPALMQFCFCAVYAYGLARFKFKGKTLLTGVMFLNILVPVMMTIIPTYLNFRYMDFLGIAGLISKLIGHDIRPSILDTPLVFYLPSILGVGLKGGLFIFIYTQFFKGLPKELEEAAWIDGAGPWKTFLRIIVPSSGSAAVTVLLFSVVWNWNDYFLPQMYLSDNLPLSVKLANIGHALENFGAGRLNTKSVVLAACLLFLVPMLAFYLVIQKKFIASIANSGIVG